MPETPTPFPLSSGGNPRLVGRQGKGDIPVFPGCPTTRTARRRMSTFPRSTPREGSSPGRRKSGHPGGKTRIPSSPTITGAGSGPRRSSRPRFPISTVALDPPGVRRRSRLGGVLELMGRHAEAEERYRRRFARPGRPGHPGASRAGPHPGEEDRQAVDQYEELKKFSEGNLDFRAKLGLLYLDRERYDDAITSFSSCLRPSRGTARCGSSWGPPTRPRGCPGRPSRNSGRSRSRRRSTGTRCFTSRCPSDARRIDEAIGVTENCGRSSR